MRSCSLKVESGLHFFLHCHYFTDVWKTLFSELQSFDKNILNYSDNEIVELLLCGSNKSKVQKKYFVLKSSVEFIVKLVRFSGLVL